MCQISVFVEGDGEALRVAEGVTELLVEEGGVRLGSLFEEPVAIPDCIVRKIDFLAGKVFLESKKTK